MGRIVVPWGVAALRWSACALLLVALACAGGRGAQREVTPEEQAAFERAAALRERDPAEAEAALQALLAEAPESPLADEILAELADISLETGFVDRAIGQLEELIGEYGREDSANRARLTLAQIQNNRGEADIARDLLRRIRFSRLSELEKLQTYELLVDLSREPSEKIAWLAALRATSPAEDVPAVDAEIDALLEGAGADELTRAAGKLDEQVPAARIHLVLAERAIVAGDLDEAGRSLRRAEARERTPEDETRLDALRSELAERESLAGGESLPTFAEVAQRELPATEGATGTVGVVLPLTGPFARFGEDTLRGVLLAARIFREEGPPPVSAPGERVSPEVVPGRLRVVVRDSAGEAERAAAAVRDLARERDLVAIVGPLLSAESEAAAAAAEDEGVPLLSLTSRESVSRARDHVFRLRTTPDDEVRFLVEYAFEALRARRFAVLYPADSYGRGMRERFYDEVRRRGGDVVALSGYDPKATDFAGPIRRLIGYDLLTRSERSALEERDAMLRRARRLPPDDAAEVRRVAKEILGPEGIPLPPRVDFDALFVPDAHDKIVLIAPQLAFHEVTDVRLLGPSGWHHPDLLRIARKHVSGAVLTSLFDAESAYPFVSEFVERYQATYDRQPDVFAAQGFDAANLVLVQLAAGLESRGDLREGLTRTQAYPGVSGVTSIMSDGNARKRPFLLGVRGGRLHSLD